MKIEEYDSVKTWFTKPNEERRYMSSTEHGYIEYMALFCYIENKTPDDLAHLDPEKALEEIGRAHV